jgi:hypothetical protein
MEQRQRVSLRPNLDELIEVLAILVEPVFTELRVFRITS